ncbi:MAG: glycosyltransferase [Paludibacteraceae bacterium]|nr:glycosyltransferase [Paludibacteraceae bacterium]MCK9615541.1 glycosyltransferase [Candidatus Omnitrophota bacterium]
MKINIYTSLNGVGLEKDASLLIKLLSGCGYEIHVFDRKRSQRGNRADIQIHLEIPRYDCIQLSKRNILIPNPEWFYPNWKDGLLKFKEIWCKTLDSFKIFQKLHQSCVLTGFISQDFYLPEIRKEKKLIHISGYSKTKGTLEIIKAYRRDKNLPKCLFVGTSEWDVSGCNIEQLGRVSESDLKRLMNENLIHLCPSYYEGWGHYLHEAASTGAIVITTDAPPMSEFFKTHLVRVSHTSKMNSAIMSYPDSESIALLIREVMQSDFLLETGMYNRNQFLERNTASESAILLGI